MPKISIIVPCYGVEQFLDRCVKSLVKQTLQDIEIILVDDASPDWVPKMCDAWAEKDSRIKVVHKKVNEGLGMACNTGIEIAIGEYIAFCDSDDYVDKEMYGTMYDAAKKEDADMVFTGLKRVDTKYNLLGKMNHPTQKLIIDTKEDIAEFSKNMIASEPSDSKERRMMVSAKVVLYRKCIIKDNNLRFVSERQYPSEDLLFNVLVAAHSKKICVLPMHFYNYMVNLSSITTKVRTDKFPLFKQLYFFSLDLCKTVVLNGAETRVQRMFMGYVRSYMCQILLSSVKNKKAIISGICKDDIWKEILKTYPIVQMPMAYKLFTYATRYNIYPLLYILAKLRRQ